MCRILKSICCMPKTNIISYVNYTSKNRKIINKGIIGMAFVTLPFIVCEHSGINKRRSGNYLFTFF